MGDLRVLFIRKRKQFDSSRRCLPFPIPPGQEPSAPGPCTGDGRGVGHVRCAAPSPIGGGGGTCVSGSAGAVSGAAAGEGAGSPPAEVSAGRAGSVPSGGTPGLLPRGALRPPSRVEASAGAGLLCGRSGSVKRERRGRIPKSVARRRGFFFFFGFDAFLSEALRMGRDVRAPEVTGVRTGGGNAAGCGSSSFPVNREAWPGCWGIFERERRPTEKQNWDVADKLALLD